MAKHTAQPVNWDNPVFSETHRRIHRLTDKHLQVAAFLGRYRDLLDSLSYETMSDKLGTGYNETPWVSFYTDSYGVTMTVNGPNARETMRTLRKALGGKWEKLASSYSFKLTQEWTSPGITRFETPITITISGDREAVCQKVVTGTKTVTVPAVEAQPESTEEVEIVDWVCGNLLDD